MITQAESGLTLSQYNAINAGGLSAELRVTAYSPETLPIESREAVIANISFIRKTRQLPNGDYAIMEFDNLVVSNLVASSTVIVASGVWDFTFDSTFLYVFMTVSGNIVRRQFWLSTYLINGTSPSIVSAANVHCFACGDIDTVFYLTPTNNNGNLAIASFVPNQWTIALTSFWVYCGATEITPTETIMIFVERMVTGKWIIVLRVLVPGELITVATGTTTKLVVKKDIQILSIVCEKYTFSNGYHLSEPSIIYEKVALDNWGVMIIPTALVKIGNLFVVPIAIASTFYGFFQYSCSVDGIHWSDIVFTDIEAHQFVDTVTNPPNTIYSYDLTSNLGVDNTGRAYLFAKSLVNQVVVSEKITFKKSPRLYGYTNCDAGVNVTNQILEGSWQFEQAGVMQINMETHSNLGRVLLRHELGYFIDSSMRWIDFATTFVDNVSSTWDTNTGFEKFQLSSRDALSWMIDRTQSYTSREWHGHQVSIDEFNGKSTKMAVTRGTLTFATDATGPFGTVIAPVVGDPRVHVNFTGMEDKRNHCQTYWVQPQGGASIASLYSIFHPSLTALTGVFLNVTTANIQLRGWHNGVNVMNPAPIVVANAQYFRIQLHYGLLRIYYSTNDIDWSVVNYPLNYSGMTLVERDESLPAASPWALSFPGIGGYGIGTSARFRRAINTNRNKPIMIADAVKIAGAFANIHSIKYERTANPVLGTAYAESEPTSIFATAQFVYGSNDFRLDGKILYTGSTNLATTRGYFWYNKTAFYGFSQYKNADEEHRIITLWGGEEIVTGFTTTPFAWRPPNTFTYTQSTFPGDLPQIESISIPVLTADAGESAEQGIRRVFDGRSHLDYFLRRTGELWMRPVTKNTAYPNDTNLIANYTQIDKQFSYVENFVYRRKITAWLETEKTYVGGLEGAFSASQNTIIDNPLEDPKFLVLGSQPAMTYQCEIPVFQELYDAIDNGYRVSRISGKLQSGFLSGSVTVGGEELL